MNIYVGNLSYEVTENELQELFEEYGSTTKVTIINDRDTGRSKGFGFVEMEQAADAEKAIQELDGQDLKGRNLRVNQAQDRAKPRRRNW
ncbi:MAG: RNA-binding protein [Candidatus Cloacimonetes bacterium]|nr:RNA-binding protein [Candidatus Cloacimonadota bacterium]